MVTVFRAAVYKFPYRDYVSQTRNSNQSAWRRAINPLRTAACWPTITHPEPLLPPPRGDRKALRGGGERDACRDLGRRRSNARGCKRAYRAKISSERTFKYLLKRISYIVYVYIVHVYIVYVYIINYSSIRLKKRKNIFNRDTSCYWIEILTKYVN